MMAAQHSLQLQQALDSFEMHLSLAEAMAELCRIQQPSDPSLPALLQHRRIVASAAAPTPRGATSANLAQADQIKRMMQAATLQADVAWRTTQQLNDQAALSSRTQSPLPPLPPGPRASQLRLSHLNHLPQKQADGSPTCTAACSQHSEVHQSWQVQSMQSASSAQPHHEGPGQTLPAPSYSSSSAAPAMRPAPLAGPRKAAAPTAAALAPLTIASAPGVLQDVHTNTASASAASQASGKALPPLAPAGSGGFSFGGNAESPSAAVNGIQTSSSPTGSHGAVPTPQLKPLSFGAAFR